MSGQLIKVAILDMYNGEPNQGMRCIMDIIGRFNQVLTFKVFDIRRKSEFPKLKDFDIFISTGGPGNPLVGDGVWDKQYYAFIDEFVLWNQENDIKKHMLLICHSFQMACQHFGLAEITKRNGTSFGVMTVHKTKDGMRDALLDGLDDPFYAVDSRDYQVVQPNLNVFEEKGAKIISLEKIRDYVQYERAIMAVRFSEYMVGTQFHPEADPLSFVANLKKAKTREKIINMKGRKKFRNMLEDLLDEEKIYKTNETLIPNFLRTAINDTLRTKKMLSN